MQAYKKYLREFKESLYEAPGPNLNDPADVKKWLDRYQRIIDTSNFVGERENARTMMNRLLAKMGRPEKKAQQELPDDAFQVVFFGHFYDPLAGKRGSDKVWGWGVKGDIIFQFWGANGKTPAVKHLSRTRQNLNKLQRLAQSKERKGYSQIRAADHVDWLRRVLEQSPRFVDLLA